MAIPPQLRTVTHGSPILSECTKHREPRQRTTGLLAVVAAMAHREPRNRETWPLSATFDLDSERANEYASQNETTATTRVAREWLHERKEGAGGCSTPLLKQLFPRDTLSRMTWTRRYLSDILSLSRIFTCRYLSAVSSLSVIGLYALARDAGECTEPTRNILWTRIYKIPVRFSRGSADWGDGIF